MRKRGIKIAIIMSIAITLLALSHDKIMSMASPNDDYIIITSDNSAYEEIIDDYENKLINEDESELLKEQETAVVNISEWEADKLEKDEDIVCIEPITEVNALGTADEYSSNNDEWTLKMINAVGATSSNTGEAVKVAVLDSGVDYNDRINVVERKNFIEDNNDPMGILFEDTTGHGTSIASIIGASSDGSSSFKGINSNVEIYSGKILDEKNIATMDRVIESIYWAIDKDVDIINMSFGTDMYSKALEIAIKEATDKGILIVAAAGNENTDTLQYPAAFDKVVAVGGVDSEGNISSKSSKSSKIDVYAPGEQVKAIGAFDGEVIVDGTSIATPHVVGVASVLMARDKTKSAEYIRQLLVASSNKRDNLNGAGILDLEYALSIYDNFEANDVNENSTYENTSELYTDSNVNYVTGSWYGTQHKNAVTSAQGIRNFTSSEIELIKWGAVYSDKSENFKGMTKNPYFHGYGKKSDVKKDYNYLAGYIYLTRCALKGEINQSKNGLTSTSGNINEMDSKLTLIKFGKTEYIGSSNVSVLQGHSNTKKNRSLFFLGMAMHTVSDLYAHSSYAYVNGKWTGIAHVNGEIKEADNESYLPKRYQSAKKVANNVLNNYLAGKEGSVNDFVLSKSYYDGSFKIRKLYQYAKEIQTLDANSEKALKDVTLSTSSNNNDNKTNPTVAPTKTPIVEPTSEVTVAPTQVPVNEVTVAPTQAPVNEVTVAPTQVPVDEVTVAPIQTPVNEVTVAPTQAPVSQATVAPTREPVREAIVITQAPALQVTVAPTQAPISEVTVTSNQEQVQTQTVEPTQIATTKPVQTVEQNSQNNGTDNQTEAGISEAAVITNNENETNDDKAVNQENKETINNTNQSNSKELDDTAKTSDNANRVLYIILLTVSGLMLIAGFTLMKKKN